MIISTTTDIDLFKKNTRPPVVTVETFLCADRQASLEDIGLEEERQLQMERERERGRERERIEKDCNGPQPNDHRQPNERPNDGTRTVAASACGAAPLPHPRAQPLD